MLDLFRIGSVVRCERCRRSYLIIGMPGGRKGAREVPTDAVWPGHDEAAGCCAGCIDQLERHVLSMRCERLARGELAN